MAVSKKTFLALIIIMSCIWSLVYSFYYRIPPVIDAQAYDRIAVNMIEGFGFKEDRTKSFEFDTAIVRAGPGYEFFLASIYRIFGHRFEAVWIIQALMHAFSALLLFFISCKIFKEKGELIGLIAAGLFGLHPDLIEISAMLMTETLYLFLIVLVVYLFVLMYEQPDKTRFSCLLGLVTGVAVLTRPPVMLFVPVILFAYYRLKKYRSAAVWFLTCLALPIVPWVVRNYLIYHQFILTTLIGEYNLWVGNTLLSNGGQIFGGFNPLTMFTETHGFFGLKAKAHAEFWFFIFGHPLVFIKLCLLRFIRYFSLIRPMGFWFYQTGVQQLIFVASSAVAILLLFWSGFTGMILAMKEKRPIFYYLIIFALTSPLVLIPTVVQSRYRFQIYPFLAIFGALALARFFLNREKLWKKTEFFVPAAFLFIMTIADIILHANFILERINKLFIL